MKRTANTTLLIAALSLVGVSIALADKLSDFQTAVGKNGCESIPYGDLQSNCKSQQSYVHDFCDGAKGPVTCGSDNLTRDVKDKISKEKQSVDTLKDKKRKLEDEKSRSSSDTDKSRLSKEIEVADKEIYEAGRRVDQANADLEARKKHVESAIYTIEKCIDYRKAVMNVYATASDKVRGEQEENIKPLARQLRDKYEESKRGHEIAIDYKKNALEKCKGARP